MWQVGACFRAVKRISNKDQKSLALRVRDAVQALPMRSFM